MLYHLEDYGKWVEITGYNNVSFLAVEQFLKSNRKQNAQVDLQFFDAQLIATQEHLYFAVLNALQAHKNKTNISKSTAMEVMLYASAVRQIQKAIQRLGVKPASTSMAAVIVGDDPERIQLMLKEVSKCVGAEPNERVLELTEGKVELIKATFGLMDEEIKIATKNGDLSKAIVDLVVEQVAVLATQL